MADHSGGPSLRAFALLSVTYILWAIGSAWYQNYFALHLTPENWANVLEGVFSPLAFLWLLYAALSQRAELELQRKELQQNNETQQRQQQQMQRQADAMERQMEVMAAQAAAKYDPIFVLKKGDLLGNKTVLLNIENLGNGVLSILCRDARMDHLYIPGDGYQGIPGGQLPYWPSGATLQISMANVEIDEPCFGLEFTRLDAEKMLHNFKWIQGANRIDLTSSESLILPSQRMAKKVLKAFNERTGFP